MTCIVGLVTDSHAWMAGDSGGFETESGFVTMSHTAKVWKCDHLLFGGAGSYRAIQIVQNYLVAPSYTGGTIEHYMVTSLVPAIKGLFEEHGFNEEENSRSSMEAVFLVGFGKNLFELQADYSIIEVSLPYHAVGSGKDIAMGALTVLSKTRKKPENILKEALLAAEQHNAFVRRPFRFVSRRNDD